MQHLQLQCIILQNLYRSTTQSIIFAHKLAVFDTILGSNSARCGAYDKLIQFYSLIHCNTWWYIATLPNTLYRSLNQIVVLPAKYMVFRTILCQFSSVCGACDKLIQFYSLMHCSTSYRFQNRWNDPNDIPWFFHNLSGQKYRRYLWNLQESASSLWYWRFCTAPETE